MVRTSLFFFLFLVAFGRYCDDYTQVQNDDATLYDYIIVGGGGAGSVLANKLSAGGAKTLLLEQGGDTPCPCDQEYPFNLDVSKPYIKPFLPTPQQFPVSRSNPFYEFTGLGGSTRIYGATYTRASKQFLDTRFPTGFKYNDLLPQYKAMEDHFCYYLPFSQTGITTANCTAWHGKNGPVVISPPTYDNIGSVAQSLLTTAANLPGFGKTADYNGDPTLRHGLSYSQQFRSRATKSDGSSASTRQSESTYSTYLPASVRARPNLFIRTSSRVTDLLIQQNGGPNNKRVRGVEYLLGGDTVKRAWAKKKVFVAAGVIGSPKLLQLAGIGPASLLTSLGISVVANNPAVGAGLKAHQGFFQSFKVNSAVSPLSYWNAVQGRLASGLSDLDDIQLELLEGVVTPYINVEYGGVSLQMSANPPPWKLFQFVVSAMDSQVEGSVQIQSSNNLADPKIDLGWTEANFQNSTTGIPNRDLIVLSSALAQVRALVNSPPFGPTYAPTEFEIPEYKAMLAAGYGLSGPALDFAADSMYLRYSLTHIYHVTSSVSLGEATDLTGAVIGVKGLHVCDNSLLPANPDANPTATMIAVCSKIAQTALLSSSLSSNSGSGSNLSGSNLSGSNSGSGSNGTDSVPWWSD